MEPSAGAWSDLVGAPELLDSLHDVVYRTDARGRWTYLNAAWTALTGVRVADSLGGGLSDVLHPDDRDLAVEVFRGLQDGSAEDCRSEVRALGRGGRAIWVELRGRALRSADGSLASVCGTLRDVTARREADEGERASRALLELIRCAQSQFIAEEDPHKLFDRMLQDLLSLTHSSYGFIGEVLTDPATSQPYLKTHAVTNIAWNEETRRLYEQNAPNLEFRNLKNLFGRVITSAKPVISNSPSTDPRRGGCPHGHPPLNAFLGLPFFRGSRLVGMVGIANRPGGYDESLIGYLDPFLTTCASLIEAHLTEKRRAAVARAALESEACAAAVVENAADAIFTLDQAGKVMSINPAAGYLFGTLGGEAAGRPFAEHLASPYREELAALFAGVSPDERRIIPGRLCDAVGMRRNGATFSLEMTLTEVALADRWLFSVVLRDITERKNADRLKTEFISTVSHELRTPLTSIRGSLGLLAGGVAGKLAPQAHSILDIALRNTDRLGLLINDILDLEKISSGRLDLRVRPMDLSQCVLQTVEATRAYAQQFKATIETEGDAKDVEVQADPDRVTQVVANLISNASKFSPAGGVVKVATVRRGDVVRTSVTDRGPGIPEEFRPRIFTRFAQADGSDRRAKGGTGLGLAICKALIELMKGSIGFDPAPGGGSAFWFELPVPPRPTPP